MTAVLQRNSSALIFILYFIVFLYAMCFWAQSKAFMHFVKEYQVDPETFQLLQTCFSIMNFVAEPLFGWYCDVYGSKEILLVAYFSAFTSYFVLGVSKSIHMLIMSRIPTLVIHAMLGAQTTMTDITDHKQRIDKLGKLNFSYGIGTILGLVINSWCNMTLSYRLATFISASGSLLSLLVVFFFIPKQTKKQTLVFEHHKRDLKAFITLPWRDASTRSILAMSLVSIIPIAALNSMFGTMMYQQFGNDTQTTETLLNYMEMLSLVTQGIIVGLLTKLGFNEGFLLRAPAAVLTFTFAAMGLFVVDWRSFCVIMFIMTLAWSVLSLVLLGKLTTTVSQNDTGAVLGYYMGLHSFVRVISPLFGWIMLRGSFVGLGVLGFICFGLLYLHLVATTSGRIVRI